MQSKHNIKTQDDIDFLVNWVKTALSLSELKDFNLRGLTNGITIDLTDKYLVVNSDNEFYIDRAESTDIKK